MSLTQKIVPVLTEKSMSLTKNRGFTFLVARDLNKVEIKNVISKTFGVHVVEVKTVNLKARTKKNVRGQKQKVKALKKAIVFLKEGEKIEVFEEEKKKRKAKRVKTGKDKK